MYGTETVGLLGDAGGSVALLFCSIDNMNLLVAYLLQSDKLQRAYWLLCGEDYSFRKMNRPGFGTLSVFFGSRGGAAPQGDVLGWAWGTALGGSLEPNPAAEL